MLSVPAKTSRPELIFLGYVQSKPGLCSGFTWDHSDIIQGIGNTAAVMSWKDSRYLAHIHNRYDIVAEQIVRQQFPINYKYDDDHGCILNWLSRPYCEGMMTGGIRRALGESKLKWMAQGTEWDNNMLASIELNDEVIPQDHMQYFSNGIIELMEEVERWYNDSWYDENSDDN
ncbi:hypothetical protein ACHAXN_010594 [Cyclotella atomus]